MIGSLGIRRLGINIKDSWICRDYQSGDEHQVLILYKEVNEREMTLDYWMWKFAKNPFGKAVIKLLFDDNKLIGHYAVMPMNVQVQKKLVKAALSVNTTTHPDYRRAKVFTKLHEEFLAECVKLGMEGVTAEVRNSAITTRNFYSKRGYRPLKGTELKNYLSQKGKEELITRFSNDIEGSGAYFIETKKLLRRLST